jgi:hypothetical protein
MVRKIKKSKVSSLVDSPLQALVRILAVSFFAASTAFAVGSITFFALIVCAMAVVTALAYHRTGNVFWKEIMCILLLFVAAVPAMFLWPFLRSGSIWAFWTPSFLMVIGGLLTGSVLILPLINKDKNAQARYFLKAVLWGNILYLLTVVSMPFLPRASYEVAGFWGAGVTALVIAGVFLMIREGHHAFGAATLTSIFSLLLIILGVEGHSLIMGVPYWLIMLSFVVPAVMADLIGTRLKPWFHGMCIGLVWAGILYTFAACFLPVSLHYGMAGALAAILGSMAGGCLSAFVTRLS